MKLLFDENLAPRLVTALADIYPESVHVRDAGLERADDAEIRLGNCSTNDIERVMRDRHQEVLGFEADENGSFLILS